MRCAPGFGDCTCGAGILYWPVVPNQSLPIPTGLFCRAVRSRAVARDGYGCVAALTWLRGYLLHIVQIGLVVALLAAGCSGPSGTDPAKRNQLDAMEKATIRINNHEFEVWLARTDEERERGLMQVPEEALAPFSRSGDAGASPIYRGMLFLFDDEMPLAFWMANTITPLDIAYIASDGRIVKTYTMAPLETRTYPSIVPAQYALEVKAGLFEELGIGLGTYVEIPDSVLKAAR